MTEVELKKWGNSIGLIVPADEIKLLGLQEGDKVDVSIIKKKRIDGFGLCKGKHPFQKEKETHGDLW